jgi:hypothetical protein
LDACSLLARKERIKGISPHRLLLAIGGGSGRTPAAKIQKGRNFPANFTLTQVFAQDQLYFIVFVYLPSKRKSHLPCLAFGY